MIYYKLIYDYNHSEKWMFLHFDLSELPFDQYDVYKSKPLEIKKIYCTADVKKMVKCDYLANNLAYLIVSPRIKIIMERFNICKCEYIEVVNKETEEILGYLINCLERLDAFDSANAVCHKNPGSQALPVMVMKYAINSSRTNQMDFFQLQDHTFPYFISDRLKQALDKNHAKGFDYGSVISAC